ncbi:MAG: YARHG domain-containing protein, partial [Methylobacteriaceae bacterium]|nr:YARHG domain-containing protein [Methylobacteriaceae bacterium]
MSNVRTGTMIAIGTMAVGLAGTASAQNSYWDYSCGQLWQARNQIYKDAGY